MGFNFSQRAYSNPTIFKVAVSISIMIIMSSLTGIFQAMEWSLWDRFFRWRSREVPDPDIVIVTIDESDINQVEQWPVSDNLLADLLEEVKAQNPRVIGLNLYRNLPIGEGQARLEEIYRTTPNLIGIKKTVGIEVAPPEILEAAGQIGFTDLMLDKDGVVRRSLVTVDSGDPDHPEASLSTQLALKFLEKEGIAVELEEPRWRSPFDRRTYVRLGKAVFTPFLENDGGYVRADHGGFQLLLNYRSTPKSFFTVSMRDVLRGEMPPELVQDVKTPALQDRIVLIGIVANSIRDSLETPLSKDALNHSTMMPGVFIHAQATSQLIRAAKDGRPLFRVWSEPGEWCWIFLWSAIGAGGRWYLLSLKPLKRRVFAHNLLFAGYLVVGAIALVGFSYGSFLLGWWVPVIPAYFAFASSVLLIGSYYNHELQKLASLDSLTQVANRRYFEEYLYQTWWKCERDQSPLSLIMCDIDEFKPYNDHYGHQQGDHCLKQVVASIQETLRTSDLMARYGGEEFVIILPKTNEEGACQVAQRICQQVRSLNLEHQTSTTIPYVTVSCGVSSVIVHPQLSPLELIDSADQALYQAKAEGRNRVAFQHYPPQLPPIT